MVNIYFRTFEAVILTKALGQKVRREEKLPRMDTKDLNGPAPEEQSGNERFDTGNSQKTDDTRNHRDNSGTDEIQGSENLNQTAGDKSPKSKHIPEKGDDAKNPELVSEKTDEPGTDNAERRDSGQPESDESSPATEPDPEKAGEPGPGKTSGAGYDKPDDTDTEKNDEQESEETSREKPAKDIEEYKKSVKDNNDRSSGSGNPDDAGSGNSGEDQSTKGNPSGNEPGEGNEKPSDTSEKKPSDNSSSDDKTGEDNIENKSEDKTKEANTEEEGKPVPGSGEDKPDQADSSVTGQADVGEIKAKVVSPGREPVDYQNMEKEELLGILEELVESKTVQNIRDEVEAIKVSFYKRHKSEIELKRQKFMQEGGDAEAFEPGEDQGEIRFKELYSKYRHSKAAHNRSQEQNKQANLEDKLKVIEDLKELVNRNEDINQTFPEFRKSAEKVA
jgi:hypothetical protein